MRYYAVSIGGATSGQNLSAGQLYYTSHPNGVSQPPDPGALKIQMDVFSYQNAQTNTNSWVRIWGVPLAQIGQASNFNTKKFTLSGGMGKGLPLANPAQSGPLVNAMVYQAYGNWIGANMTLDVQLSADLQLGSGDASASSNSSGTSSSLPVPGARNLVMNWTAGMPLDQAIRQSLSAAYPGATININIKPGLVLNHDEPGYHFTLQQFSDTVQRLSQVLVDPNSLYHSVPPSYPGVQIVVDPQANTIDVSDGTTGQDSATTISFTDLVGQPTWIAPGKISVTCIMRADLKVMQYITLPPTQLTTTQQSLTSFSQIKQGSVFTSSWMVTNIRHVGDYKQPGGESWVTILTCTQQPTGGGSSGTSPTPATTTPIPSGSAGFDTDQLTVTPVTPTTPPIQQNPTPPAPIPQTQPIVPSTMAF